MALAKFQKALPSSEKLRRCMCIANRVEYLELAVQSKIRDAFIVGHIKVLAKLSDEEFLFLSLIRLERVDVQSSSQWICGGKPEVSIMDLNINVLVFSHSMRGIAEVVDGSLMNLRWETM